jgi:hypothetical protein
MDSTFLLLGAIVVTAPISIPIIAIASVGWMLIQLAQTAPSLFDAVSSSASINKNKAVQTPQEKMQEATEAKSIQELGKVFDQMAAAPIPKATVVPPKPIMAELPKVELPKPPKPKTESRLTQLYNSIIKPKKTAAILKAVEPHVQSPVITSPPVIAAPTVAATPADEMVTTVKPVPQSPEKAQVADRVGLMNHPPQKMKQALDAINDYFKDKGASGWQKEAGQGHDIQFKDNKGNNAFEVKNDKMVVQEHNTANMEATLIGFKAMYGDTQKPSINCPPELKQQWQDVAAKLGIPIELKGPVPKAEIAAMKKIDAPTVEAVVDNTHRAGNK